MQNNGLCDEYLEKRIKKMNLIQIRTQKQEIHKIIFSLSHVFRETVILVLDNCNFATIVVVVK